MTDMTSSQTGLVPIHSTFEALAESYDALLCDVWGVLHNGVEAYDGVVEALTQYRQGGGRVLLLSNASRPSVGIPPMLEEMGIPRDAYDDVLTSGDATRASVRTGQFGDTFWHLGPERNAVTFDGLPQREVAEEAADFILCTALIDAEVETPDDYVATLARLKDRDLDLVCANPDIIVDHGKQRRF
ncbi:MAG: TIGR01459 family HAD-type hydrolase, partial [Rhodobiaceae bacterium]|nr:TIGR01459 family HAD-type hydrolase [Rhodobiaceae bacterium]